MNFITIGIVAADKGAYNLFIKGLEPFTIDLLAFSISMMLEACVLITILCGFFGIVFKKNLVMKIISMDIMSTGVVAYFLLVSSKSGVFTPIWTDNENLAYADPVPQAVILTAIVIGFSIQALMLVGVIKLAKNNPTLEIKSIEKSNMP